MRVQLFGKNSSTLTDLITQNGLDIVTEKPDLILSYGGDGTLLASERKYPSIPKLPIRDSKVCNKCSDHTNETLLAAIKNGQLKLETLPKLQAKFNHHNLQALNDLVIRNTNPIHAIRFLIKKNNEKINDLYIGDGIVVSTVFGSTAYYKSITGESIKKDFSLAFNNTTLKLDPLNFESTDVLEIEIVRGPATLSADNNPEFITLEENDKVEISVSEEKSYIYSPQTLRCTACKVTREKRLDS